MSVTIVPTFVLSLYELPIDMLAFKIIGVNFVLIKIIKSCFHYRCFGLGSIERSIFLLFLYTVCFSTKYHGMDNKLI
jgi:hypothetical protein